MDATTHPVTLTAGQVEELKGRLADLRHNVANQLSLIVAATELIRRRPEMAARFADSLVAPPKKITDEVKLFSAELEKALAVLPP